MEAMSSPLFLVQDENQSVIGVLARDWMLRRISDYRGTEFSTLSEAIENLSNDPNEIARGFHHEWLTEDRIDLLFCPNGYYVVDNPCLDHGAF